MGKAMDRRTFLTGCVALGLAVPARAYSSTRLSVQVKGEGPDVIGRGVLLTDPANGDVVVWMAEPINYQRQFRVPTQDVTVLP